MSSHDKYRIRIPDAIDAKMSAWGLPTVILHLMEDKLRDDLAIDPINKSHRVIAPWEEVLNLFTFTIPDASEPNVVHQFMFHFFYGQDEQSLVVADCGYSRIEKLPPSFPSLPLDPD
jgi:hypothetical protein